MNRGKFAKTARAWLSATLNLPDKKEWQKETVLIAFRELYGGRTKACVEVLNAEFGTAYTARRYNEWIRGDQPIPWKMREFIQAQVILSRFDKELAMEMCDLLGIRLPGNDLL